MNYQEFFDRAKARQIKNIQITETTTNNSDIEIKNKNLEAYNINSTIIYDVKAEYNNRTVKLTTEYLNDEILDLIITKGTYIDSCYQDEYLNNVNENNETKLSKIEPMEDIKNRLYKLDEIRLRKKYIKELTTYYIENEIKLRIINSNGVDISTVSHLYKFIVAFVLDNNKEIISYDKTYLTTSYQELEMEKYVDELYEEAKKMLIKEKLETKKYNIILSSSVAGNILSHLGQMVSASEIRQKISCLENKLNEKVFSEKVTVIEDPTNKKYPGFTMFDEEGTKTYKKDIIKNGVLKTYLYNLKEAKEAHVKSTGNGYGAIKTRNMYIKPGKKNKKEVLETLQNGLYVTDYMGASGTSIDCNTGNISLQVFGFVVENGKIKNGFEACVMTTNIFELLTNIEEIANNLEFSKVSSASPDLLIKNISIAAN